MKIFCFSKAQHYYLEKKFEKSRGNLIWKFKEIQNKLLNHKNLTDNEKKEILAKVEEKYKKLFINDNKDKITNDKKLFQLRLRKYGDYMESFDKERIRLKERIWLITQEKNRILRNKHKNKENKDNKDIKENKEKKRY